MERKLRFLREPIPDKSEIRLSFKVNFSSAINEERPLTEEIWFPDNNNTFSESKLDIESILLIKFPLSWRYMREFNEFNSFRGSESLLPLPLTSLKGSPSS